MDLELAYRQLPVKPSHAHWAIFPMKNPETGVVKFLEATALPFSTSVCLHGFNRAAHAIEHILIEIFGFSCTHCVDDFTSVLMSDEIIDVTKRALTLAARSIQPDKDAPPDVVFKTLDV